MNIALDFDSVVNDLSTAMCNAANTRFNTTYKHEDWITWDFWSDQPQEIHDYLWQEAFVDETFTLRIPPMKDAIAVVRRLMNEHNVYIFSDRKEHFQTTVESWFSQYGLWPEVVLTDRYTNPKAAMAVTKEIDLAIDDAPHNVIQYVDTVRRVMIYDHPWNRDIELPLSVERVFNWKQILNEI